MLGATMTDENLDRFEGSRDCRGTNVEGLCMVVRVLFGRVLIDG
jgi:hypothetical protein